MIRARNPTYPLAEGDFAYSHLETVPPPVFLRKKILIVTAVVLVIICLFVAVPLALTLGSHGSSPPSYKSSSFLIAPRNDTRAWLNSSSAGDFSSQLISLVLGSHMLSFYNVTELGVSADVPLGGGGFVLPANTATRLLSGNLLPVSCSSEDSATACSHSLSNLTSLLLLRSEPKDGSLTWALYFSMETFDRNSTSPPSSTFHSDIPVLITNGIERFLSRPAKLHLLLSSSPLKLTRAENSSTQTAPRGLSFWAERTPLSADLSRFFDDSEVQSVYCAFPQKIPRNSLSPPPSHCDVHISSSSLTPFDLRLTITNFDKTSQLRIVGSLNTSLAFTSPPLAIAAKGELNNSEQTLTLSAEISSWNFAPLGLQWLNLSRARVDFQMNSTTKFLELFADAKIQIPTASSASAIRCYARSSFQQDLVLVLDSLPFDTLSGSSLVHLADPSENRDWTDLVKLDTAPEGLRYGLVVTESPLQVVYTPFGNSPSNGWVVHRGLTLIAKGSLNFTSQLSAFFSESFSLQFSAGIHIPIFSPSSQFSSEFEALLYFPGKRISDHVSLYGVTAALAPLSGKPELSLRAYIQVQIATDSFLVFVAGALSADVTLTVSGRMQGSWHNAFGISGLTLTDTALEISLSAGPTVRGIGLATSLQMGDMNVSFAGAISVETEPPTAFIQASGTEISLHNLAQLLSKLNSRALPDLPMWISPLRSVFDSVKLHSASILIAPMGGEISGVRFEKGFGVSADAELLHLRIGGSLKLIDRSAFGFDLQGGFSISSHFPDIDFLSLLQVIFPGIDFGWLDGVLSAVGLDKISVSDIIDIRALNLTELSITDMARGTSSPKLYVHLEVLHQTLELTTDISPFSLVQKLIDVLLASNIRKFLPQCVTDGQCNGDTARCDHSSLPWRCVSDCPTGTVLTEAGCFTPNNTHKRQHNTRMDLNTILDRLPSNYFSPLYLAEIEQIERSAEVKFATTISYLMSLQCEVSANELRQVDHRVISIRRLRYRARELNVRNKVLQEKSTAS